MNPVGSRRPDAAGGAVAIPLGLVAVLLAFLFVPAGVEAQRMERQAPLLPTQGVVEITRDLRDRLGLFPDFAGFERARLFLGEPGAAVLELEGVRDGVLVRERRELDDRTLAELRASLEERFAAMDSRAVFTREGRGRLVLDQTFLGLGFHGWALPVALDVDSSQGAVAAYLLTAGAHFYVPYRLTRNRTVSDAHQSMTWHGGTRGILSGILLADIVQGDTHDSRTRGRLAGGMAMGTLGSVAGFMAVDRWTPAEGSADLWGFMGDAGLVGGAAVAYIAGPYADETVDEVIDGIIVTQTRPRNRPLGHAITLAGQGTGFAAGAWLGARRSYTPGNVSALRSASILGVQTGVTLTRLAGVEEGRGIAAGGLAAGLGGVWAGDHLLRELGLTGGEGLLINAGHLAGAALALGTTYLIVDDLEDREVLYLTTSTVGSLVGAGLVWRAVARDASRDARGPGGRSPGSRVSVEVNPAALIPGSGGGGILTPTLLTIRF